MAMINRELKRIADEAARQRRMQDNDNSLDGELEIKFKKEVLNRLL